MLPVAESIKFVTKAERGKRIGGDRDRVRWMVGGRLRIGQCFMKFGQQKKDRMSDVRCDQTRPSKWYRRKRSAGKALKWRWQWRLATTARVAGGGSRPVTTRGITSFVNYANPVPLVSAYTMFPTSDCRPSSSHMHELCLPTHRATSP